MKKPILFVILCTVVPLLPAQENMYERSLPTESVIAEADSATFVDAAPESMPESVPFFTVSAEGKKILFAPGNLQYTFPAEEGGEGTWTFAKHQYDIIGTDNCITIRKEKKRAKHRQDTLDTANTKEFFSSYWGYSKRGNALANTIDLFGWSGSIANTEKWGRWGISSSISSSSYTGNFKDWGQNIGDGTTWRTLSQNEWEYLLNTRENASILWGFAHIILNEDETEYANGLILLPDDWQPSDDIAFKSGSNIICRGGVNIITLSQWQAMEIRGAVFLPAAGERLFGTEVCGVWERGAYWSSSPISQGAYAVYLGLFNGIPHSNGFYSGYVVYLPYLVGSNSRNCGCSVRLVRDL